MTLNPSAAVPGEPQTAPRRSLSSSLNLTDKIFSTGRDREVVRAIEEGIAELEARLIVETEFNDGLADVAARYLLEAGGKRVRPILVMLTAQLGDGVNDDVITASTSIELIHLASLYHDDVMDTAPERRGVPTAQNVWGNSVAILIGDLLFARSSRLLTTLGEEVMRLQADTFERLCMGQLHETIGPRDDEDPIEHYMQVLSDKTGSLIAAAARMGVVLSNAPRIYEEAVVSFGEKVGIAFQLIDDVIDMSPPASGTGKVAGTDVRAGVVTLPILYLRKRATTDADAALLLARLSNPADPASDIDGAIAELRAHPVTVETIAEAHRWAREAIDSLGGLPDGTVKKTLTRFADSVVNRTK